MAYYTPQELIQFAIEDRQLTDGLLYAIEGYNDYQFFWALIAPDQITIKEDGCEIDPAGFFPMNEEQLKDLKRCMKFPEKSVVSIIMKGNTGQLSTVYSDGKDTLPIREATSSAMKALLEHAGINTKGRLKKLCSRAFEIADECERRYAEMASIT